VWQVQTKNSSLFFQILWDGCETESTIVETLEWLEKISASESIEPL
jgi:hypothetical protein